MKKLMFSTAAIVMALSFNAFAGTPETKGDAEAKVQSKAMDHRYINVGNGKYLPSQTVGETYCNEEDTLPCFIDSDEWEPDGFNYSNKPGDSQESAEKGKVSL